MQQMYDHLTDGGIIQITRMGANMERLRLLVNVQQAFTNMGLGDLADSVCVVTAQIDGLTSLMIKKGKFTESEVASIEAFTEKSGHGKLYLPLRTLDNNIIEQFIKLQDKQKFIDEFPRRITPTTDDQPYFFNFTRWDAAPAEGLKYIHEATEVSQGNPAFLWGQLAISSLFAFVLIVVPLLFKRGAAKSAHAGRFLIYFIGIGVGFIFLEIALMQKLTLLLGQPLYSIVVTLFSILIFTGLGSWLSDKWLSGGASRARAQRQRHLARQHRRGGARRQTSWRSGRRTPARPLRRRVVLLLRKSVLLLLRIVQPLYDCRRRRRRCKIYYRYHQHRH